MSRKGPQIGSRVTMGKCVQIYDNTIISDDCEIEDFCVLGHPIRSAPGPTPEPLQVGSGSLIRSHTILYEGCRLGEGLETGHHVLIREGTIVGKNLRIGSYSSIEGRALIGDYCRFHGYVQVGSRSVIGNFVWLFSLSLLMNDPLPPSDICEPPILEDGVVVCADGHVMPGAILRTGSFVASNGVAMGEIPAGAVVDKDGRIFAHVAHLSHLNWGISHPWMTHYSKEHYPEAAWPRVEELRKAIMESREGFAQRLLGG